MQNHLETFIALCHNEWEEESIPPYAERALRRYLECGILAYGFARARCAECGHDFLVAFSCKGRGICPSCNSRHMVETAAHLVDHVFPPLPVRQWVLSLPKRLRYHLQRDPKVLNSVLRIFLDQIERHLRANSAGAGEGARIGAVAFIHRFGASLNQHIHFHVCVIDGVFGSDEENGVRFFQVADLDSDDIEAIQSQVRQRILLAFVRRGILDRDERKEMARWDHGGGFSLDASVRISGNDRQGLERLLRYCARPPFAADRLEELDRHRLIYHLTKPNADGRTQLILSPLELIARIAALIPPPRLHSHRYYGVFAPNVPLRAAVTALAPEAIEAVSPPASVEEDGSDETLQRSPARYLWAMLLARIYETIPLTCPNCGAEMRIIAFITDSSSVQQILGHIGEPSTPPVIAPARGPPEWEFDEFVGQDQEAFIGDSLAQPEPEYEFDQRVDW
jgi:hypothetical protein